MKRMRQNDDDMKIPSTEQQYFADYGTIATQEVMLKDTPRTEAYLNAIKSNVKDFEDKVILDVGCGTGVLSMFAVLYGKAKKVYAVEASDMSHIAKQLIEHNNMSDRIEVINDLIENVELPEKVDIIISEWMGFYLLHESMFNSVIIARDKWLKDDGKMYPSKATIYACPCSMDNVLQDKVLYWTDIYGLDFSPIISMAHEKLISKPYVDIIQPEQLIATPQIVKEVDCRTATVAELEHIWARTPFVTTKEGVLHGFALWFDVKFEGEENLVVLDTSPSFPATHWKQTIIILPEYFQLESNSEIPASFTLSANEENFRHYTLSVQLGEDQEEEAEEEQEESHEVDCDCMRCRIIRALTEKYENEETDTNDRIE
jgi:predicted RNA methylase